jgi:ArsR family transcriptional regulator
MNSLTGVRELAKLLIMNSVVPILDAIASPKRLQILEWLKAPRRHFPPQVAGDLVKDGVCGVLIAQKLRVSQPTVCRHMKLLVDAGLVRAKRIKQWTFYKRDEKRIAQAKRIIVKTLG